MKILIADDSQTTRNLLAASLKKLGHDIIEAENGKQAIDLFEKNKPDLIILDVIMEEIDGFECARRIRQLSVNDWVPIIFLSGAVDDENIARGINAGGDDYLTKPYSEVTLFAKIKAMQRISDMRSKLYELTQRLSALSSTDPLTGIYNRLQFDRSIKEKVSYAKRYNKIMALLFVDLDKFKVINDTLGHYIGDLLLIEIAKRLQSCLRLEDFIARIGGDEFAIILSNLDDEVVAEKIAEKILEVTSKSFDIAGHTINISPSIGIAMYPSDESKEDELVRNADIAMYHAKECGRNNYKFFTFELNKKHKKQQDMANALKGAAAKNELYLTFHPIFNLKTQKIVRVEALMNWKNPIHGNISPEIFIPLAEELEVISEIGDWAIRAVCKQAKKWLDEGHDDVKYSLNISPLQLLNNKLATKIKTIIQDTRLPANLLEFELTETSALIYSDRSEEILNELQQLGINITLDDFGTGFSSLIHLRSLPIVAIKIDKIFIKNIPTDQHNNKIVRSVIALGNNLGFSVIAEGIENKDQLLFLIENDCAQGQGFYLSKVLSTEEMGDLLTKTKMTV